MVSSGGRCSPPSDLGLRRLAISAAGAGRRAKGRPRLQKKKPRVPFCHASGRRRTRCFLLHWTYLTPSSRPRAATGHEQAGTAPLSSAHCQPTRAPGTRREHAPRRTVCTLLHRASIHSIPFVPVLPNLPCLLAPKLYYISLAARHVSRSPHHHRRSLFSLSHTTPNKPGLVAGGATRWR
jgi:hypothetical protein